MSTFRAFQSGLQAGQEQRKLRDQETARTTAADAFKSGNFEGAVAPLMQAGLMQDAEAYTQAGERHKEKEKTEVYASAFKTGMGTGGLAGGAKAVQAAAGQRGDMGTFTEVDKFIQTSDTNAKKQFVDSMEFLGSTAQGLKNVAPEMRGQAAMEILQQSPFANEQILAQIQQAAADGKIDDAELDAFAQMTLTAADRVKMAEAAETRDYRERQLTETGRHNQAMEQRQPGNGISLEFGENGSLSGLSVGGTGTKGNEPAVVRGPNGEAVVSPGQQQLVANKDYQRIKSEGAQTNLVREDIKRALALVGGDTTGGWSATKDIPIIGGSTKSGQLANALATIKANVGFDKLAEMRQNSPTGGALGNVSEKEIAFLQSVQGSLEQAQTAEDLAFNLKRLDEFFANRDARRLEAFAQDYPSLAEFAGFRKDTAAKGAAYEKMSVDDLKKRADELRAKAGKK